ncbi:AraC family transcriptional regulator [Jeotgalibaca sp. MA1X17-3]|uniref:helix-turn-helix domain-containing protein n=1 Tax=Jeotgalibaca sp. MA1X17-3 TaxID=2908211 RepID=UPI001F3E0CC1|nr:helix-turn-helix domain-containing protein [Jeotgalibaca sp. MA1X17-3]UJF16301.1 AraC family transcriptional regulator [Jeotgalibaca sp. MA1X17-3]
MTTHNYPYIAGDYNFHNFKPTELSIKKEMINISEKKHFSNEIEFIIIIDGNGQLEINNQLFSIQKGMFIQLMPYHVYKINVLSKQFIECYRIRFSIGLLLLINIDKSRYLKAIEQIGQNAPILSLDADSFTEVCTLCQIVFKEKQNDNQYMDSLHVSLISFLIYYYQKNKKMSSFERTLSWKLLEYIHFHHQEQITLSSVSAIFKIDSENVQTYLKQLTGFSFSKLLNQVRIRNASALLQFEDLSINQIGKICGYQTDAYFYKSFKNIQGITPLQYRSRMDSHLPYGNSDDSWQIAIYLLEHCREELYLEEVAVALSITKKKINSLLKDTFQKSFQELLNFFRVQIGKTFLLSFQLPVQEVALLVGFRDVNTFIRNFKKIYAITPKQMAQESKDSLES